MFQSNKSIIGFQPPWSIMFSKQNSLAKEHIHENHIPGKQLTMNLADLRWLEKWDLSSLLSEHVDLANSQAAFNLPMVDLRVSTSLHIALSLSYDSSDYGTNGVVGNGWTLHNTLEYIFVDHHQSVFPENYAYQLYVEGRSCKLKPNSNFHDKFTIDGEADVKITYDKSEQRWIVETPYLISIYGNPLSTSFNQPAHHWSLSWPSWRGPGRREDGLRKEIIGWYLVSKEDKHGSRRKLNYNYKTEQRRTPAGREFTSVFLLDSVFDSTQQHSMKLLYSQKAEIEFVEKQVRSSDGTILFPIPLSAKYFLRGFYLTTGSFQQELIFDFRTIGKRRVLASIGQVYSMSPSTETEKILDFTYHQVEPTKFLLNEIQIPSYQSSVKFSYNLLQIPLLKFEKESLNTMRYPTVGKTQMSQSGNFAVMAFDIDTGGIYIRLFNKQLTRYDRDIYTCPDGNFHQMSDVFNFETARKIIRFATIPYSDLIAVVEETEQNKVLNLFHRNNETSTWPDCPNKKIVLPKDAIFRYSNKIMAVAWNFKNQYNLFTVIEPIPNDDHSRAGAGNKGFILTNVNLGSRQASRFVVEGSRVLLYDGDRLWGYKRTDENRWQEYLIFAKASQERKFFDQMTVGKEMRDSIIEKIRFNGLHVADSMIMLSTINWDRPMLTNEVNMLLVDENFQVKASGLAEVKGENIETITREQVLDDDTVLTFNYKMKRYSTTYKAYLEDIKGPMLDKACKDAPDRYEWVSCRNTMIEDIQKQHGSEFEGLLIFDPEPFFTFQLEQTRAITLTKEFELQGNSWLWKDPTNTSSIRLSTGYVLETYQNKTSRETRYSMFRQNPSTGGRNGGMIDQFVIGPQGTMAVGYPSYIAKQPDLRQRAELIVFPEDETKVISPIQLGDRGEQILEVSNHEILATIRNITDPSLFPFDKEIVIRRVNSVVPSSPMWAISKIKVRHGSFTRIRSYRNTFVTNDKAISQENKVQVIAQGEPSKYGWYEECTVLPIENPENSTKSQNWYNSKGELVLSKSVEESVKEQQQYQPDEDKAEEKAFMIMDASGQLEIANISPFNLTENMVAYFGFEKYELNTFKFHYPVTRIIEDQFSLTGERLIRLGNNDSVNITITPGHQTSTFLASAWVRLDEESIQNFTYDLPVEYFRAQLKTHKGINIIGLHAQMKRQVENWTYIELAIDLDRIRSNVYSEIFREAKASPDLTPPLATNFTIFLVVDSVGYNHIDVDHIRFAPIHLDFPVSVYDSMTGTETEMITANGGITRSIYDGTGFQIASVNEDGNVEQVQSSCKSGQTFPFPMALRSPPIQQLRHDIVIYPEQGTLEMFDKYSVSNKWSHNGTNSVWQFSKRTVTHANSQPHVLSLKNPHSLFHQDSSAVRMTVTRQSADASLAISLYGYDKLLQIDSNSILSIGNDCRKIRNIPMSGELLLYLENDAIFVWFDGILLADRKLIRSCLAPGSFLNDKPWSKFEITISGNLQISDFITMSEPQVTVEYQNAWGDRTQVVQLDDANTAVVTETLYDELGRDAIKVKSTKVPRKLDQTPLFQYYEEFIINRNPYDENSVFKTGIIQGIASDLNELDEGYPYNREIYHDDMLREVMVEALPGKVFSVDGSFTKKHGRHSGIIFLKLLFPPENGFTEKVTYEPNGSIKVTVLDTKQREVAEYIKVVGFDNILSIKEYDKDGNLIKLLPPNYHKQLNTFMNRTTPWNFGDENLSSEEIYWQENLGAHFRYNELKQLVWKKTPDLGTKGYMYDTLGNIRFMYNLNANNESVAEEIIYLLNSGFSQPIETGYIPHPMPVSELEALVDSTTAIPTASQVHQRIIYSASHSDPKFRNKLKLFLTYNDDLEDLTVSAVQPPHQELLKFNAADQVVMKTSNALYSQNLTNYIKHYKGQNLRELQLPITESSSTNPGAYTIIYSHDKLEHVKTMGTRQNPSQFVEFSYNAAGQVKTETIEPGSSQQMVREYVYDSPGLLKQIRDPFLTQETSFIEGGYGQKGYGDGIITQSVFNSSWSNLGKMDTQQRQWFQLPLNEYAGNKIMTMCLTTLKRLGFVDKETSIPLKFLTESLLSQLPQPCGGSNGHELQKLIAKYIPMSTYYGHKYAYGSHRELVKAKFVASDDLQSTLGPLQVESFLHEIDELVDISDAESIWDALVNGTYIVVDNGNPDDKLAAVGKQGRKSMFCNQELSQDLAQISSTATAYIQKIMDLLYNNTELESHASSLTLEKFQNMFVEWNGYLDMPTPLILINRAKQLAAKIYTVLVSKQYLHNGLLRILDPEFVQSLHQYSQIIGKICNVLKSHFQNQIGTNVYDYESFRIDPNGNHEMFYMGFNRYQLEYNENTNKVSKIKIQNPYALPGQDESIYELKYDSQGNVNTAPHKGVRKIKYHPLINRPTFMELTDGRRITIKYDAQGERVLKRVFSSTLKLVEEVKYLRDEEGTVLMDTRTTFNEKGNKIKELTSTYLYGPRKTILGFIRNGKFYNVFTDHAGSPRLITHKGKVVAGYDYWSYGELMKSFGDEDAQLMYRFTGQEYDSETGLYNFHARIYDPTIGRFFQPDPMSQYFSPYVYAGNSPISLVDPDGEFFVELALAIAFAVIGAYLAGAAANGSFNPAKWDWKSSKTWLAIIGGGIAGAMLPAGFASLAAQITTLPAILVGVGGAYLQAAIVNGSWNFLDWDWTNPATYNAFLEGFGSAVGMAQSVANLHAFASTFTKTGQKILVYGSAAAAGGAMAFWKGQQATGTFAFWKWDLSNPAVVSALLNGFTTGIGLPEQGYNAYKNFAKLSKNKALQAKVPKPTSTDKKLLNDILKEKTHMLFETLGKVLLAYLMGSMANDNFDVSKWDWTAKSTYEGLLNGWRRGEQIKGMYKNFIKNPKPYKEQFKQAPKEVKQYTGLQGRMVAYSEIFERSFNILFAFAPKKLTRDVEKNNMIPIAVELLSNILNDAFATNEFFEETKFEQAMHDMMSGLQAGASIIPTTESGLQNFVDCVTRNMSTPEANEFYSCDIGKKEGRKHLQNRELIKRMFISTKLYQSKSEFLEIPNPKQPNEFSDMLFNFLKNSIKPHLLSDSFVSSMMVGSLYNSLINSKKLPNSSQLYFTPTTVSTTDIPGIHSAMITKNADTTTLTTRSVLSLSENDYIRLKSDLQNEVQSLRYECLLPTEQKQEIRKIQAEILAIVTSTDNVKLHIITPDFQVRTEPCPGTSEKFISVPTPDNSLVDTFHRIQTSATNNPAEQLQNFEVFLKNVTSEYNKMRHQVNDFSPSFPGFVVGFIMANLKVTYNFILNILSASDKIAMSMIPTQKENAAENFNRIPMLIHFVEQGQANERRFLFESAVLSLAKTGMIGFINSNMNVVVRKENLPSYDSVLPHLFARKADKIESLIQYLYYNHRLRTPLSSENPSTENAHFISNFILGEFLSKMEDPSVEIHAYAPNGNYAARLNAQRIFFVRNTGDSKAAIFNIIESSVLSGGKFYFNDAVAMDIPSIPNVQIKQLILCELKLNINSQSGWNLDEALPGTFQSQVFFQSVICQSVAPTRIPKDTDAYLKLESPKQFTNMPPRLNFEKDFVAQMFENFKENRLQKLINTNLDFQSVIKGLLVGTANLVQPDVDGIKLALRQIFTESNSLIPDITPLSLVSIAENGQPLPQTEQVLLSSLKAINTDKEDEVIQQLNEAKEDIKSYYCQHKERISQVLKLTKVPAVYNSADTQLPENMDRVKFKTDPDHLSSITCDASENPFKTFEYQYIGNPKSERKTEPKSQEKNASTKLDGCHLGAWVNGQYSMDGISCNSDKFRLSVFKKIGEGDLVTKTARGLPFTLVGDNYNKEACKPIEFNGQSSVVCEGDKTTLVYTPYVEPRLFDQLDGNIMLGRVFVNIGGKIWNFVRERGWKGGSSMDDNHLLSDSILDSWKMSMGNIDKLLSGVEKEEVVEWAKAQIGEIREQIEKIEQNDMKANPEIIEDISEQLEALEEDITEQILYANVDEMFGRENHNDYKNEDDGLFESSNRNALFNNIPAANLQNNSMLSSGYFAQFNGHIKTN